MPATRTSRISRPLVTWITGVLLAAGCMAAQAANFIVSPVRAELSPGQSSAALTVTNETSDEPVVVELRAIAWSQKDGEDIYTPTTELIATPPIFHVAPGGSQVVRVALRRPPASDRETAYRLILREVPPPPKPGFAGIQIALEMSLPVFAKPRAPTAPALQWKLESQPGGAIGLSVHNQGSAHAQIADLKLLAPGIEQPVGTFSQFAYILPGETRHLPIERGQGVLPETVGSSLHLTAYSDAGEIDARLAPEQR
jgi:fimbrial chaperone protein